MSIGPRQAVAQRLGAASRALRRPGETPTSSFHASATPSGLATALAAAGMEATVVEMSWYGDGAVPAPSAAHFHSRRLKLYPPRSARLRRRAGPRWNYARRHRRRRSELLADDRLDALITEEVAFADLPGGVPRLLAPGARDSPPRSCD